MQPTVATSHRPDAAVYFTNLLLALRYEELLNLLPGRSPLLTKFVPVRLRTYPFFPLPALPSQFVPRVWFRLVSCLATASGRLICG